MKIDLWKFVQPDSLVIMNPLIKEKILSKLKQKNIGSKLAKILELPLWRIKMWRYRNIPLTMIYFVSLMNLVEISTRFYQANIQIKHGRRAQK